MTDVDVVAGSPPPTPPPAPHPASPRAAGRGDARPWGEGRGERRRIELDWVAFALVVAGLGLRVVYLIAYASLPFLEGPAYDSDVYLRQAAAVRAGDFGHPTLVAFSPLYGYALAALGAPADLVVPVVAQLLLGAMSGWLLYVVGRALFDRASARVALVLWLGYGLLPFHESKIMAEALGMALVLGAYALYVAAAVARPAPRPAHGSGGGSLVPNARLGTSIGAGVLLGLAVLARANLVLTAPFLVLAAALPWRLVAPEPPTRTRLLRAGGLALGLCAVLGAHGTWTFVHTGFFVPVIMVSQTAAQATRRDASGTLEDMAGGRDDAGSPWSVVRQAEERIARRREGRPEPDGASATVDPVGALVGAPSKVWRTIEDLEISFFDYGYYGERTEVGVLRALPVTWGILELGALLGAVLLARRRGIAGLVPVAGPVIGVLLTAALFHPSSRYRVVMVLPLLWLSGYGIAHLGEIASRRLRIAVIVAGLLASGWLAQRTVLYELDHPGVWHLRVAEAWLRQRGGLTPHALAGARARVRRAREVGGSDPRVRDRIPYLQSLVPEVPLEP